MHFILEAKIITSKGGREKINVVVIFDAAFNTLAYTFVNTTGQYHSNP